MSKKHKKKKTASSRKQSISFIPLILGHIPNGQSDYIFNERMFDKFMNEYLQKNREGITAGFETGVKNMHTRKFMFQDGVLDKTHEVELCEEPIVYACFPEDFARMVQLFRNMTDYMDFSQPFRAIVDYDPEGLRTAIRFYETKEALQRHSERVMGNVKG
ncbi:MAG: hypothetical protein HDR71_15575 [Lachnospiraceae bacterium]|nr:hypothetical protein [Lachnospiraceae bacterium]